MFDATLQTSSSHDHTYLRLGGAVNVLLSCYAVHVFFPFLHIIVHHAHIFHATLYMFSLHDCTSREHRSPPHLSCYNLRVFFAWLYITLTCILFAKSVHHTKIFQGYGTVFVSRNGDKIIAMPCGKWCPKF